MGECRPLRGGKFSLFEGGTRSASFLHSALLPPAARGRTYTGLLHVSDWCDRDDSLLTFARFDVCCFSDSIQTAKAWTAQPSLATDQNAQTC